MREQLVKKVTLLHVVLVFLYGTVCFFILGIILRYGITYVYTRGFDVSHEDVVKTFVMSCITGAAATIASFVFAKIDEHKARKNLH